MKILNNTFLMLIVFISIIYPQNKDSLREYLFKKGLISRELYYQNREDKSAKEDFRKKVDNLRDKIKYKSALDIIVAELDSESIAYALKGDQIEKFSTKENGVLEAFTILNLYFIYQYYSFDGNDTLLLIAEFAPGFVGFYLLSNDLTQSRLLDKFELSRSGEFDFGILNGGNIIKVEEQTTGSGFYGHPLYLVTINNRKFIQQYHCYLSTMSNWNDTTTRTLSKIQYHDINKDGNLDLIVTSKTDILDEESDINVFNDGELEKAKSIRQLSETIDKFMWHKQTLTFQPLK